MNAEDSNAGSTKRHAPVGVPSTDGMTADSICASCGQPLIQGGTPGECLRCLVNFASLPEDEELEEEREASEPVRAAQRRYGHFELARGADGSLLELGHGAMGTTYRAQDTVLHCAVALKVIDRKVAEHPAARERFLREARAAAQFQHPNVARVSHYGEQEGECFYAMELVEGETLEARVRREGPLPVTLTLAIAIQVTKALVAAEARGIIHRDLKPTNLMLTTPEGEMDGVPLVKVIDFGLAKAVTAAANAEGAFQTRNGFVGTPAFASPEQFDRSEETRIDHRSDIYSLGITMWYALCGRTPFAGRSLAEIHCQQAGLLPLDQLTARQVPASLIALLKSMLAVEPSARPPSARVLLDELRLCQQELLSKPAAARDKQIFRWLMPAALLVALTIFAAFWWMHRPPVLKPEDRSLAVLPFENLSPSPDDAFYAIGVQDEVTVDLSRVAALKVIGPDSASKYPPGKRDFARIGRQLGVRYLLEGSVRREQGQARVEVRLIDATNPDKPWIMKYNRPTGDIFLVQSEITRAVADRLQATLSNEEKAIIDEPPTTDLVAYDLYLRAREMPTMFKTRAEGRAAGRRALALLEKAVARDPRFALAYCEIAGQHDSLYQGRLGATPQELAVDHQTLAQIALQKASQLKPDDGLVHLAYASHYEMASREHAQARIEVDLARRTLPNNPELEQMAGLIARSQGRWDDAIRALEKAATLQPRDPTYFDMLVWVYRETRRYEDADRASAQSMALKPVEDSVYDRLYRATGPLAARADLAPLRAALAGITVRDKGDANFQSIFQLILNLCEHDPAAVSRTLAAAAQPRFDNEGFIFPKTYFEGLAARMRDDEPAAQAAFASARIEIQQLVNANPGNAKMLSLLAVVDAGLGHKEEAVREARLACERVPLNVSATNNPILMSDLAVVYAWTGEVDQAIDLLDDLVNRAAGMNLLDQPSFGDLKLNPVWDPLRASPRFASVLGRLAPDSKNVPVGK